MTHEWVTSVRPQAWAAPGGLWDTEVSVSVTDHWVDGQGWVRSAASVQVEGGTFPVEQAARLRAALDDVLARLAVTD